MKTSRIVFVCLLSVATLTAVADAAQEIVAGQLAGGGGSSSGGGMTLVGSIPASPAGASSGGGSKVSGGFIAAAQVWREGVLEAIRALAGQRGMLSSLAAVPTRVGAQITFSLPSAATVEVRVLNLAGRLIRIVTPGTDCPSGLNTFVWTGVTDNGLAAPNGRYLVEVRARTPSGTQTGAMTACSLAR
jgi:FlgD Ig-like domain